MLFAQTKKVVPSKIVFRLWIRKHWITLVWSLLGVCALFSIILGVIGFRKNLLEVDKGIEYPVTSLIYMTIQLFFMKSGAQPDPLNWELETARWLSLAVSSTTIVQGFLITFRKQFQEFLCKFKNNHFIICGFGVKGKLLFDDLVSQGNVVIVIDKNLAKEDIVKIDYEGAYYLLRDNYAPSTFLGISLSKARGIFITSGKDINNIQIAEVVSQEVSNQTKKQIKPIDIYVECQDNRIFKMIAIQSNSQISINFHQINTILSGSRIIIEKFPFDYLLIQENYNLKVNLIVIGASIDSEAVILQLCRLGHFANLLKPLVTLICKESKKWKDQFLFRFPQVLNIIEIETFEINPESCDTKIIITEKSLNSELIPFVFISQQDEEKTISIAMELNEISQQVKFPILVNLKSHQILKEIILKNYKSNITPINFTEAGCNTAQIFKEELDKIAKMIHEDYLSTSYSIGRKPFEKPSLKPWDDLDESFRQACRDQADHISVKLRAIHCNVEIITDSKKDLTDFVFTDSELEMLSKMEHSRWKANRWLEGFVFGEESDSLKKTSPFLVPWINLEKDIKQFDRNAIKLIPKLLKDAQIQISRD